MVILPLYSYTGHTCEKPVQDVKQPDKAPENRRFQWIACCLGAFIGHCWNYSIFIISHSPPRNHHGLAAPEKFQGPPHQGVGGFAGAGVRLFLLEPLRNTIPKLRNRSRMLLGFRVGGLALFERRRQLGNLAM